MESNLLPQILHLLPKKNRKSAADQINFYLKEIEYKIKHGTKFVLSADKIEVAVYAIIVYQRIISPISHSLEFYDRMTSEFGVDAISVGSYSLNEQTTDNMAVLVDDFKRMVYSFFVSNGIEQWKSVLSVESVDDLIRILRMP